MPNSGAIRSRALAAARAIKINNKKTRARELNLQSLTALAEWLQATSLAVFIHNTPWVFTTIEVVHVFAISLVIGTIAIVDLRLLGFASTRRPVAELAGQVLPFTWIAFVLAAAAGLLLFISRAAAYLVSTTFQIKMAIIVLAGINMLVFELITARSVQDWNVAPKPRCRRGSRADTLTCWVLVVIFGRWTGFTVLQQ